jgi:hypothetical protein
MLAADYSQTSGARRLLGAIIGSRAAWPHWLQEATGWKEANKGATAPVV